jgi:hypothetical protein
MNSKGLEGVKDRGTEGYKKARLVMAGWKGGEKREREREREYKRVKVESGQGDEGRKTREERKGRKKEARK